MARIGPRSTVEVGGTGGGEQGNPREDVVDPRSFVATEAGAEGADSDGGEPGARTQRKERSDKGQSRGPKKSAPLPVDAMVFSLTGIHALLASTLGAPELAMTTTEAEYVAKSYAMAARHFDMQASQKALDIGNFVVVLGVVYGGRLVKISTRRRNERIARQKGLSPAVVVQPASSAPQSPNNQKPGAPTGAAPLTRPKTPEDNSMLDEIPIPMFSTH